jgi:hypothetical protein
VPNLRKYAALLIFAALAAPIAACGEDDVKDQVDQSSQDIRQKAKEIGRNIDDLSEQDLREALRDAEDAAKGGSADAKREARELERKIERELDSRN